MPRHGGVSEADFEFGSESGSESGGESGGESEFEAEFESAFESDEERTALRSWRLLCGSRSVRSVRGVCSLRGFRSFRLGILIGLATGAVWVGHASSADAEVIRVAMAPVSVNSSLTETRHLSEGLADMIAARLEQSGQILVIPLDAPAPNRDVAVEAAKKVGAAYVLFGSYTQFGDGASLDLRCAPVEGTQADEPRRIFVQAGSASEIIPKLGVLSESVTRYLVGTAEPAPAAAAGGDPSAPQAPDAASIAALEKRIDALERVIFAPPAAPEPATEPPPSTPE